MTPEFWNGRRVFITGHTGFKGAWLCLWLQQLGAHVTGYSLPPPTQPNLFELADVAAAMSSIHGDIRDLKHLITALQEAKPEIVFHLAAQSLVRASYDAPVETFSTNLMGTVHLLEALRHCPSARAAVIITSDKCYENREWLWAYRENEALGGHDPYSASKAGAELITAAYRDSFFPRHQHAEHRLAIATARAGNVIGGGDWAADRLFPDLVAAFLAKQPVVLRNPSATRPWQHVLEPLSGYLSLAEHLITEGPAYAEAWNFGPSPSDTRTVGEIAERAAEHFQQSPAWRQADGHQPHEARSLSLDSQKARTRLDWRPHWSLDKAIAASCDWYKSHARGEAVATLTRQQIAEWLSDPQRQHST